MSRATGPDIRDLLETDFVWTPRQREVLDRITAGKSNQQIADELGISLDGAKWHMREILSKLNLETREDAAEYWRLYNGWRPRLARAFRGFANATALKWAATGGAVIVLGVAAIAAYAALSGDEERQAGDPIEGSPTATATVTTAATQVATPAPTSAPTAAPTPVARTITLDSQTRPQPPETTRVLGAPPNSVFPPWDGASTVIYDIERGTAIDLGPGAQPAAFSPDETMAVWVSAGTGADFGLGSEGWLLDLRSGARTSLGPARLAGFTDSAKIVVVAPGGNDRFIVDPATGQRSPASEVGYFTTLPQPYPPPPYVIDPPWPHGPDVRTFTVTDRATGAIWLTFEGVAATAAGPEHIAAMSPPVNGRSNVYLIEIATGKATVVASAIPGQSNIPFTADEQSILWTDGFCGEDQGMVTLFDRASGTLARLDLSSVGPNVNARYAILAPENQVAIGSFGAAQLIDRDTLAFNARIPMRPDGYGGDISWSSNYKYASRGIYGGHGGLC